MQCSVVARFLLLTVLAGFFASEAAEARCVNTTTGGQLTDGIDMPSSGQSVVCDNSAPNPSTTTISSTAGSTGVTITVMPGTTVSTTARAIGLDGNASSITNQGTVRTSGFNAFGLSVLPGRNGNTITNNGLVATTGARGHGLDGRGGNSTIVNAGTVNVSGAGASGIRSIETTAGTLITNSGTVTASGGISAAPAPPISANGVSLLAGTFQNLAGGTVSSTQAFGVLGGDGNITLRNAGTITGGNGTSIQLGNGNNIIEMTAGQLNGAVVTGSGADQFTWSGGGIAGAIGLGAGNDTAILRNLTDAQLATTPVIDGGTGTNHLIFDNTTATGFARFTNWANVDLTNGTRLTLTAPASSSFQVDAGARLSLQPVAGAGFVLNNPVTGTGTVFARMGAAADTFAFGPGAGTAFAGLVELADGKFTLSGTNTAALTSATLQLDANNTTIVGVGTQAIGGFTMNGGTAIFATTVPSDTVSPANISTGALTLTSGNVQITIPNPATVPASFAGPGSPSTLLQQDDGVLNRLVSATSVSGSASGLTLIDQNGVPVPANLNVNIAQGGSTVAVGSYGYGLTSGPANNGLYVSYGLTQLNLQAGQMLSLSGDDGTAAGSELHASITGAGNLAINATNTITLNNASNNYTGTTTVANGTLALGASGALGQSSSLIVNPGATANINGTTQNLGALDISGTLDLAQGTLSTSTALGTGALTTHSGSTVNLNGGTLNIANGGTTAPGSLTGGGSFNLAGGTLAVNGANPGLTGSTAIASGAAAVLNDGGGLGSGGIANNGSLIFNAATGTFVNNVTGAGAVSLTNTSNVIATGAIDSSGPKTIDAGSTLQLGNGGTSGSIVGNITNNGSLLFDRSDVIAYADVISGTGGVSQIGSGTTILNGNNSYAGGTQVNAGTLVIGDANHPAAALSGAGPIQIATGGTLGGYGSVTGPVNNAGTIGVGNTLAGLSGGPNGNFTINGNLTNSGLAQIGGVGTGTGNTLTVAGNYIGAAGTLRLNTVLGTDGSPSDRLVIAGAGASASGSTAIAVANVGGGGAVTVSDGIAVVQVTGGATTAAGSFSLAGPVAAGAYEYMLFRGGVGGANPDNMYLRSALLVPVPPTPPGTPPAPEPPQPLPLPAAPPPGFTVVQLIRPEVAVHSIVPDLARTLGLVALGTFYERRGDQALLDTAPAAWGRVFGQHSKEQYSGGVRPDFSGTFAGFQTGFDAWRFETWDGVRNFVGVSAGYARATGDVNGFVLGVEGARAGTVELASTSVGGY
jgi:autotransporter-associated beta strand protein